MENIILGTFNELSLVLVTLIFVSIVVIQYLKEKWNVKDKAAEVVSLCVSFFLGLVVVLSYLDQNGWRLSLSSWLGVALFMLVATVGPAGGYKAIKELLGPKS